MLYTVKCPLPHKLSLIKVMYRKLVTSNRHVLCQVTLTHSHNDSHKTSILKIVNSILKYKVVIFFCL